jgi:hypothetical protein
MSFDPLPYFEAARAHRSWFGASLPLPQSPHPPYSSRRVVPRTDRPPPSLPAGQKSATRAPLHRFLSPLPASLGKSDQQLPLHPLDLQSAPADRSSAYPAGFGRNTTAIVVLWRAPPFPFVLPLHLTPSRLPGAAGSGHHYRPPPELANAAGNIAAITHLPPCP